MKRLWILTVMAFAVTLMSYAQPGGGMRQGGNGDQMLRLTIEERMEKLDSHIIVPLALNEFQSIEMRVAYRDFFEEMDELMKNTGYGVRPSSEKVDLLVQTRDAKIKAHLTPELYAKYLELEKEMRPTRSNQNTMPR